MLIMIAILAKASKVCFPQNVYAQNHLKEIYDTPVKSVPTQIHIPNPTLPKNIIKI